MNGTAVRARRPSGPMTGLPYWSRLIWLIDLIGLGGHQVPPDAMVAATFLVGLVGLGSLLAGTVGGGRGVAGVITGVVLVLAVIVDSISRRTRAATGLA